MGIPWEIVLRDHLVGIPLGDHLGEPLSDSIRPVDPSMGSPRDPPREPPGGRGRVIQAVLRGMIKLAKTRERTCWQRGTRFETGILHEARTSTPPTRPEMTEIRWR